MLRIALLSALKRIGLDPDLLAHSFGKTHQLFATSMNDMNAMVNNIEAKLGLMSAGMKMKMSNGTTAVGAIQ